MLNEIDELCDSADFDEDEPCCISYDNGFKCVCLPSHPHYNQQAEDDGLADYEYENKRDAEWEDKLMEETNGLFQ